MFVASVCDGYRNRDQGFETEREAERWLEGELRRTNEVLGCVYEIDGGIE